RVDGAERELDVALRVDVVQYFERDLADVLHVDVFIDHEDALGGHCLAERPYAVHDFARLAGIGFLDRHDHQIVEDAFDGQIDVNDLRNGEPHQRQENARDGTAHPCVFHRR